MEKTITLNETQMELLKNYIKVGEDVVALAKQCRECPDGPAYRVLNIHFENKRDCVLKEARVLAESLAIAFVAEQGPQVNPVEIASEAETSVF
jgi:hypothetical protein